MDDTPKPLLIALKGELDIVSRSGLGAVLDEARQSSYVILDLSEVTYLDSSAIGAFILLHRSVVERPGGGVVFTGASSHVRRIAEIAGLGALFPSFDTVEDALREKSIDGASIERRHFEAAAPK